jgi:hypothetical protein
MGRGRARGRHPSGRREPGEAAGEAGSDELTLLVAVRLAVTTERTRGAGLRVCQAPLSCRLAPPKTFCRYCWPLAAVACFVSSYAPFCTNSRAADSGKGISGWTSAA